MRPRGGDVLQADVNEQVRDRPAWLRGVQVLLFLLPPLLFAYLAWHARAVVDDAYINFRIVANILDGHGPVYNIGERVESGTSPAWLAILSLLALLGGGTPEQLPMLSVVAGIAFGTVGVAFAQGAAASVWRAARQLDSRWPMLLVPAGSVVVVAVPPFREFVACGLETGLVLCWIGACAWALASRRGDTADAWWRAAVIGLGPLVRPEMAVIAAPSLVALLTGIPPRVRRWTTILAWAGAVPLAAEVFRMGYYAALVPNTALAKEAFGSFWARGAAYVLDFVAPYWLLVPLLPLGVMVGRLVVGPTPSLQRSAVVALLVGGGLDALYVMRLGGDFMHARMLLPALFAALSAVTLWPVRPRRRSAAFSLVAQTVVLVLLAAWGLWCAAMLRVSYPGQTATTGLADEVNFYRRLAGHPNPVNPEDYRQFGAYGVGRDLHALAAKGERWLVLDDERWSLDGAQPSTIVTDGVMIGLAGYVAGPFVHIADTVGLTDPIASRLRLDERGRTGHEKSRPRDWLVGRFGASGTAMEAAAKYPGAAGAKAALGCGGLRSLLDGITEPLTFRRFVANVGLSFSLTRLRVPADPVAAEAEVCGPGEPR